MEVFFFILIGSFITFVEILANECGHLTLSSNQAKEGETATLILNSPLHTTQRSWETDAQTVIYNSSTPETVCKYKEEKYENGYKLHIYHVDANDGRYYYVYCHLPDGTKVWSTGSQTLRITPIGSQENDCGILIARQNEVIEGNDYELSFKSYYAQQNINWQKWDDYQSNYHNITDPEINKCEDRITILKVKGTGTTYTNKETFRVSCGQTISNVVNITIVRFSPIKPTFIDVRDIHECKKCISTQVLNPVTVKCNSTGGTHQDDQWYFKLYIGNKMVTGTVIDRLTRKTLTYDFTPTIQDINTEFKCIVQNRGANEELVETAKLLIYVKPSKIEVTRLSVKENQSSEIQCTTYGGRPQLQPLVFINEKHQDLQIIENISTGYTYTVRAGLNKTFSRANNNSSVSCCVDLLVGRECTKDMQLLNVLFPPIEIEVKEIYKNITEDGDANITLTCNVSASNPPCSIVWTEGFDKPVTTRELVSENEMTFNLTRKYNGQEIRCTAVNSEFPDQNISALYVAKITYAPLITIPEPNRTVYVGDYVDAMCYVDSNPESKIVWLNGTERLLEIIGNRLPLVFLASSSIKGLQTYTCVASNNIGGIKRKHLTVFIEDRPVYESGSSLDRHWTLGIVVMVIGFMVCFIVTMIIVVIRKRRKEQTPEPTTRSHNLQNTESDVVGNISENPVAYDSLLPKSERNTETVDQEYLQMMVSHSGGDEEEREHVYEN